jgi:hypothetical protein
MNKSINQSISVTILIIFRFTRRQMRKYMCKQHEIAHAVIKLMHGHNWMESVCEVVGQGWAKKNVSLRCDPRHKQWPVPKSWMTELARPDDDVPELDRSKSSGLLYSYIDTKWWHTKSKSCAKRTWCFSSCRPRISWTYSKRNTKIKWSGYCRPWIC